MKRHLLVTNDFPPKVGGIQNYLWELWRRLDPDSFVVLTASSDPGAAAFDAAQAARGVRIERVPESILYFPTPNALRQVRRCVAEHAVDLVLLDPALPLGLLGPRLGVPYGVILHGAEVTVPGRLPVARTALGHVLRGSSVVISAGGYPAAEGRRAAGELAAPVVEIPPGAIVGILDDFWQRSIADVGLPGPDGAKGGKFLLLPPGYSNIESMKRIRAAKITGKPQTLDDLVRNGVVIVGSPNTVREKLAEYQDLAGFNTSLTKTQFGTLPDDMARANMTAIAQEILPHFRDRAPQGKQQAAAE